VNLQFASPPDECRPLQFVPPFEKWCGTTVAEMTPNLLRMWNCGVRGLVVTVSLEGYLVNDEAWQTLRRGVKLAHELGFRVWIYDEEGYPSGAAGGLVLARHPLGEAQGLVRHTNSDGTSRYEVVRLFEGTHATENFYARRPYINILDEKAVQTFIEMTHEQYARALNPIEEYVDAFFTDEPSLISCYVPRGREYPPTLPWHPRIPDDFRRQKGYDLLPHLDSLFQDTEDNDRKIRCDFYDVIARLSADTYFGTIQQWCRDHGVASSGHLLGEETMVWQTLFEGNPFPCYAKFDIPGIDMILSDPERIMRDTYFLVPKLASSAARLSGKHRLMCEISDFLGEFEKRPASTEQILCTTGIMFALGVTDFVSMYPSPATAQPNDTGGCPTLSIDERLRTYADFAGRLRALFRHGRKAPRTAVIHPLLSIWSRFLPSPFSMYDPHPDPTIRRVDEDFVGLCRFLLQHQVDYDIIDEASVADARISDDALSIGNTRYDTVILPPMDTVHVRTMETLAAFAARGGSIFSHATIPQYAAEGIAHDGQVQTLMHSTQTSPFAAIPWNEPPLEGSVHPHLDRVCRLTPSSSALLCANLNAPEGSTYFFVNTSASAYQGVCALRGDGRTYLLDPSCGSETETVVVSRAGSTSTVNLALAPFQSLFIEVRP
jgi:hypothetical protein